MTTETKLDDGVTDYPHVVDVVNSTDVSLRDAFAIAALQGMTGSSATTISNISQIAEIAYKYADAMLRARKKDGG